MKSNIHCLRTQLSKSLFRGAIPASSKFILAAGISVMFGHPNLAHAASYTWDSDTGTNGVQDGGGTWSATGTNWLSGGSNVVFGNTNADTAVFGAASGAAGTITLGGAFTANGLTFNAAGSGNYTLSSGTIILDGASATITTNVNATITSPLSSGTSVTKSGAGILTLDPGAGATSTIGNLKTTAGGLTVSSGSLNVNVSGAAGGASGLYVNGGTFNVNGGAVTTLGYVTVNNGGTLLVSSGTFFGTGELLNGYGSSSTLTLSGGLMNVNLLRVCQTNASAVNLNGGMLQLNYVTYGGGSATVNFNGSTIQAKSTQAAFLNAASAITYKVQANGAVFDSNGYTITIPAPLVSGTANDGGLTKLGAGTLILSATNTYVGPTTVSSGTLQLGGTAGMLTGAGAVTVGTGASLILGDATAANNNAIVNRISSAATLSLGGTTAGATLLMAVPAAANTTSQTLASLTLNGGFSNISANGATGTTNLTFNGAGGAGYFRNGTGVLTVTSSTGFNPQFTNAPTAVGGSAVAGTAKPILVGASLGGNDLVSAAVGTFAAPAYDTTWGSDATLNATGGNITATTNSVNAFRFNDNTGARTVTLLGTGTTVVQSGMILVGSAAGNGQTVTGGTITSGNGRDLIVWDNRTVEQRNNNAFNLSPVVSDNGGTKIALTVAGGNGSAGSSGGQVWLNNNNTYTGGTILNGGSVDISADTAFGAVPGSPQTNITVVGGGWIRGNAAVTLNANRNVTLAANSVLTLDGQNGALTINGAISGSGNIVTPTNRNALVVLNGTNTFTGYYYSFGTLRAIDGVGIPTAANLQLSGNTTNNSAIGQQGVLETSGTFTRSVGSGAGQVQWVNYGGGGFAAYGGPLTVALGGTASPTALTYGSGGFAFGGSGLDFQDTNATNTLLWMNAINLGGAVRNIAVGGPAALSNATAVTMSGVLSNGGITIATNIAGSNVAGVLILSASNTYASATTVNAGVLRAADGVGLPTGSLLTLNGAVFETSGTFTRTAGSASGNAQITGGVSGFSAYGSPATIALGGTASPTALTWGSASFNPTALVLNEVTANNPLTFANAIDLSGSSARTINVNANTATMSGALTGGTTGLTKGGAGTLVLAGANTYGGTTTLTTGTINLGSAENAGTSGPLGASLANNPGSIILNGGYLQYSAANQNDYSGRFSTAASQQYNVDTNGQTVTWGTALSSTNGSLTKLGLGTLALSGSSTYAGATTVSAGTLQVGAGGTAGGIGSTSGIAVAAGAALAFDRADDYGGNFSHVISGAGGITLASGSLTLSGVNTFNGDTVLSGGTLTTGIATVLQNSTLNYNNQGGSLSFGTLTAATLGGLKGAQTLSLLNTSGTGVNLSVGNNNASTIYTGIITGTNSASTLTKVGTGTLTLDAGSAASGTFATVTVNTGTMELKSGTTNLSNVVTVAAGAALNLTGGSLTVAGNYPTINGTMNISGGTFSGGLELLLSFNTTPGGVVNLSGSGVLNVNQIRMGNNANVSTLNLNGGTLQMNLLNGGGNTLGIVNLNGSTIQSKFAANDFLSSKSTYNVLAGGAIFNTAGYNVTVQAPLLSGAVNDGGLTKSGAGTLTLSGSNSYNGATTINAGTLSLAGTNALAGGGRVTFGGGTLQFSGSNTNDYSARIVSSGSAISLDANGQSIAFASSLALSNTGGLTLGGNGTLTLSASNAYTGVTTINSGTLQLGNGTTDGSIGASSGIANSGALVYNLVGSQSYAGTISGAGTLTKSGGGTLTLNGSNTYTGATAVTGGVLQIGDGGSGLLAAASAVTISSTGTLGVNLANGGTLGNAIANFGGTVNLTASGTNTLSGYLSGWASGVMNQNGIGTTILSGGANYFFGTTNINAGLLQLNAQNAASSSTINANINNGLAFGVNAVILGGLSGSGNIPLLNGTNGVALTIGGNNADTTYTGALTGSNGATLTKTGAGTFTFAPSGISTIASVTVNQGKMSMTSGSLNSTVFVKNNATFEQTDGTVTNGNYPSISGIGGASLNVTGGRFQGATELLIGFGGGAPGTVNVSGSGTVAAFYLRIGNGSNAIVNLSSGGTIETARLYTQGGGSTLNLDGGTIRVVTQNRVDFMQGLDNAYINTGGVTFDTNGFSSTAGQPLLTGTGLPGNDGGLIKTGAGTLTLSGSNTYNGGTTINNGTLQLGNANGLGAISGNLTINGGTLDLDGYSATVALLSGTAGTITSSTNTSETLTVGSALSSTYSGTIANAAGALGVIKTGTGMLTLSGNNSYAGGTVVAQGTLRLGNANALGTATNGLSVNGGTLDLNGYSPTVGSFSGSNGGTITTSSTASSTLTANSSSDSTYAGVVTNGSGKLSLTKNGAGTLTLDPGAGASISVAAVSLSNGGINVNSGTMTVTNSGGLKIGGATDPVFTLNGGNLVTNGQQLIGGDIPGGKGQFTLTSGTWTNTGSFIAIMYGSSGSGSVLNVNGGVLSAVSIELGQNAGTSTMNLNGGTVQVDTLFNNTNPTSVLNFNGGTLRANADQANFINLTGPSYTANVLAGGALIDTNGHNVTISIPLLSGTAGDGGLIKNGAGTLTLTGSNSYGGGTTVNSGVLNISGDVALGSDSGAVTIGNGATLQTGTSFAMNLSRNFILASGTGTFNTQGNTNTINGSLTGAGVLAKTGPGTLLLSGSVGIGGLNADNGVVQLAQSGTVGALNVGAAATVSFLANGVNSAKVIDTSSLSISTGGTLDLWDNAMIVRDQTGGVNQGANLSAIQGLVNTAFDNGNWDKPGITSSSVIADLGAYSVLTVMVYDNTVLGVDSFEGINNLMTDNGGNQVMLKTTYLGDFDGNGIVNSADYGWLDFYYGYGLTVGDLNGDGQVNSADYNGIDYGYGYQAYGVLAGSGAAPSANAAAAAMPTSPEAVPEPGCVCLALLGGASVLAFSRGLRRRLPVR